MRLIFSRFVSEQAAQVDRYAHDGKVKVQSLRWLKLSKLQHCPLRQVAVAVGSSLLE